MSKTGRDVAIDEDIEALLDRIEQSHHALKRRHDVAPLLSQFSRSSPRGQTSDGIKSNQTPTPDVTPRVTATSANHPLQAEATIPSARSQLSLSAVIPQIEKIRESINVNLSETTRNLEAKIEKLDASFKIFQSSSNEEIKKEKEQSNQALLSTARDVEAIKSMILDFNRGAQASLPGENQKLSPRELQELRHDLKQYADSIKSLIDGAMTPSNKLTSVPDIDKLDVSGELEHLRSMVERNLSLQAQLGHALQCIDSKIENTASFVASARALETNAEIMSSSKGELRYIESKLNELGFDDSWVQRDFDRMDLTIMEREVCQLEDFIKQQKQRHSLAGT